MREALAGLSLTRRSLLQTVLAFAADARFSTKKPLAHAVADDVFVGEIEDGEVAVHARAAKLESFLKGRGIQPAQLARESGYSRQHLLRLRIGWVEPTPRCIARIADAARRISREKVTANELWETTTALQFVGLE